MSDHHRPKARRRKKPTASHYFGMGKDDVVYAYTPEEWGPGGTISGTGIPRPASVLRTAFITVFMFAVSLYFLFLTASLVVEMHWGMYVAFALLLAFGAGSRIGGGQLAGAYRAHQLRRANGKPKPQFGVSDDLAYDWFQKHPDPQVPLTLDAFPGSSRLKS